MNPTAVRPVLHLLVLSLAASCGGSDSTGPGDGNGNGGGNGEPVIATVQVAPPTLQLAIGESEQLAATARTATGQTVASSFTWSSQNEDVATVSSAGLVQAIGSGSTNITARAGNVSGFSQVSVAAPIPEAPSDLVAIAQGDGQVHLTWADNSSTETGFEVQRSLDEGSGFSQIGVTDPDVTTFADDSVEPETTYYYRVRALGEDEPSDFSDVAVATTDPSLMETLTSIEEILGDLLPDPDIPADGRDLGAELEAIGPALAAQPGVLTVIVHQDAATAQVVLTDGTTVLVNHNRLPFEEDQVPVVQEVSSVLASRDASAVPAWNRAVAIAIDGGEEVAAEMRQLLTGAGFDVVPSDGSVQSMRQYKDLGVLYLDTHGASFLPVVGLVRDQDGKPIRPDFGPNPTTKYAVETTTVITSSEQLAQYEAEFVQGDLVVSVSSTAGFFPKAKLAITETFIERNWSLDHGLVVLHTCFGGAAQFTTSGTCFGSCALGAPAYWDATPVRTAILTAGADAVLAFDNYVWATTSKPAMEYFLDRLTGANHVPPDLTPERRAFDLEKVRAEIANRGLTTHQKGGRTVNTVIETSASDIEIIGAPSIERIDVTDDANQPDGLLEIFGTFGDDPGAMASVRVGGQPANIEEWTGARIAARTPFEGSGTSGGVVVRRSGVGLESNEVPLTEWRGDIEVIFTPGRGSLEAWAEIDARFRADVHRTRWEVEGDPEEPIAVSYFSPASTGQARGAGSFSEDGSSIEFLGTDEMRVLSKVEVDAGGVFSTTESVFGGFVTLDPEAGAAEICFSLFGKVTVRTTAGGMTDTQEQVLVLPPFMLFDSMSGIMGCMMLPMNSSYVISGDTRVFQEEDTTIRLEVSDFQPISPPEEDTKG